MKVNPYLTFNGNCEEAVNFYKTIFNGEFESFNRFKDGPGEMGGMKIPEHLKDKIMHVTLRFGDNCIMASDSFEDVPFGGNMSLSINLKDKKQTEKLFNQLSEGGNVTMPLENTFWGAKFGMFTDRFGVHWMINCEL